LSAANGWVVFRPTNSLALHSSLLLLHRLAGQGIACQAYALSIVDEVDKGGTMKMQVLENASMEKASTKQLISQGWETHERKTQVRICRDGKRKYGKCKYNANFQSDKISLVLHKLVWCIFK